MNFLKSYITLLFCLLASTSMVFAQNNTSRSIVEVSGVVLAQDSVYPVSNAVISVLNRNKGVISNEAGIFSIVVYPGDSLLFESVGYKKALFVLPKNYTEKYYNRTQILQQDTFFLPETIISNLPTGNAFIYAFKYWPIFLTAEDVALAKLSPSEIDRLLTTIPMSGSENYSLYSREQAVSGQYYGQNRNMSGIVNPLAWAQFFDAWKRGDFRRKKTK